MDTPSRRHREIDARPCELEAAMEAFEQRPLIFDAAEVVRAGAFVTLDQEGSMAAYHGYVRPEDEPIYYLTDQ